MAAHLLQFCNGCYLLLVFVVTRGGRFSDGWGSCERREKRFLKPNHDIPSTAETRAKNKACQVDLLPRGSFQNILFVTWLSYELLLGSVVELYMSLYARAHTWSRHKSPKELGDSVRQNLTSYLMVMRQ